MYKILSLNGGGIRSIFTARILDRLEKEGTDIVKKSDLFAGNSGGSIVAAALACGYSPEQVVNLFREEAAEIFKRSTWDYIKSGFGLAGPKYGDNRKKAFIKYFGDKKLSGS